MAVEKPNITVGTGPRIIVALDYDNAADALAFVKTVSPSDCRLKVGLELFTVAGASIIEKLVDSGFDIFLDLKFHDIPNTVANACRAAAKTGVWMMNVHALGGLRMMQAAREAIDSSQHKPLLIGVTILTSHSQDDIQQIGLSHSPAENVAALAALAKQAGLDGIVCSPREAAALKESLGQSFMLVTPGVRPAGSAPGDQQRVMTPAQAIEQGSDYLVIGRPITRADDPTEVLAQINASLPN